MKVAINMAVTANGIIAKPDGSTPFVSEENWAYHLGWVKAADNTALGRVTYDVLKNSGELKLFKGAKIVVVTRRPKRSRARV